MLRNLLRSATAITVGQMIIIFGNLAVVPLFLAHWSSAVYGEWMALSAAVAYLTSLDMGMNAATGNSLVVAYAHGDQSRYQSVQSSAMVFYMVLAAAVSALTGAACLFFPLSRWLGVTHIQQHIAALIVWIMALRLMWQMPAAQIWNIFRTMGDQATTQWVWNVQFLGGILATCCAVALGGSPSTVALWAMVPFLAVTLAAWGWLRRRYPQLLPTLRTANRIEIRNLLCPSLFFGLITVGSAVALNGPVVAVSSVAGGAAVTLLVTTRTLATVVRQAQSILTTAIWPHLTRMHAAGARSALRTTHRVLIAVSMVASIALASTIWFEGPEIIAVWTRGRLSCDIRLLRVFLVAAVFQALWVASSMVLIATNRHRALAKSYLFSALIATAVTALLVKRLGPVAAAVGLILGEAVSCYHFVLKDSCAAVGEVYSAFATRMWASLILVSSMTSVAALIAHRLAWGPAPIRWMETGIVALVTSSTGVWTFFLGSTRQTILARIGPRIMPQVDAESTC